MPGTSTCQRLRASALLGAAALALAGCQVPTDGEGDFRALAGGSLEDPGAVIEEPGVFRIAGGEPFTTPFAIDCTHLSAVSDGWREALAAGAHAVTVTLPGEPGSFGGVLALCKLHKSATGPASRAYRLAIPAGRIPEARDGLVASLAEQVPVNRPGGIDLRQLLMSPPGSPLPPPRTITEDYAWMLWLTDRPDAFAAAAQAAAPSAAAAPAPAATPLPTKGAAYLVTTALNLRAGPGTGSAVLTVLPPGQLVVATGAAEAGFWAVTTADGRSGWVAARNLKAKQPGEGG